MISEKRFNHFLNNSIMQSEGFDMANSKALTKIHSIILISIIIFAAVTGTAAYVLWSWQGSSSDTIKVGLLADLYGQWGNHFFQGAVLAAEQINAAGGVLGKKIEVIAEDMMSGNSINIAEVSSATARLLHYHDVDFIIAQMGGDDICYTIQDMIVEDKTIVLAASGDSDGLTQRVLDDYDRYKYFFRTFLNTSSLTQNILAGLLLCREITGFNRIGYLGEDKAAAQNLMNEFDSCLPENGFELVYQGRYFSDILDCTSYFAAAEAAGTEILVVLSMKSEGVFIVKEYHERQSPMLLIGAMLRAGINTIDGWEISEGKCNYVSMFTFPTGVDYSWTSKTLPVKDAYFNRWNEPMENSAVTTYNPLLILADAIERAGTIETDAVIAALERTSIETMDSRDFVFTSSHDAMMGDWNDPESDHLIRIQFQWQNGQLVPVFPKWVRDEVNATYIFPDWPGPWSK